MDAYMPFSIISLINSDENVVCINVVNTDSFEDLVICDNINL